MSVQFKDEQTNFDIDRAYFKAYFPPFYVNKTLPLAEALSKNKLSPEEALLVVERGGEALSLITRQMNFHHVAQGELAGEPWMATF